MAKALCMVFCVGVIVLLLPLGVTARLCCDPECKRKISRVIILLLCSDIRLLSLLIQRQRFSNIQLIFLILAHHTSYSGLPLSISIRLPWAGLRN